LEVNDIAMSKSNEIDTPEVNKRLIATILSGNQELDSYDLKPETTFISLSLTSQKLIQLIINIEDQFDILIEDEELTIEIFKTIDSLGEFIRSKISVKE
jgi:acyl carrier protein